MQNNMDPQTRRVIMEPCSNIRKLGRTALAGKWGKASIVIFLLTVLIEAPQFILNYFFGKEVVVDLAKQLNLGTQYQNMIYKYTFSSKDDRIVPVYGPVHHFVEFNSYSRNNSRADRGFQIQSVDICNDRSSRISDNDVRC